MCMVTLRRLGRPTVIILTEEATDWVCCLEQVDVQVQVGRAAAGVAQVHHHHHGAQVQPGRAAPAVPLDVSRPCLKVNPPSLQLVGPGPCQHQALDECGATRHLAEEGCLHAQERAVGRGALRQLDHQVGASTAQVEALAQDVRDVRVARGARAAGPDAWDAVGLVHGRNIGTRRTRGGDPELVVPEDLAIGRCQHRLRLWTRLAEGLGEGDLFVAPVVVSAGDEPDIGRPLRELES
mmetsp:Transcript_33024/g.94918  ORF Transcript_33024/g.94918 Transcript_33024/m.94918 type:complete len:237 (-) Transcript_33024:1939-2649(-)